MSDENSDFKQILCLNDDIINSSSFLYPMIDAHMHIQGNDVAPIPIMKGILLKKLYDFFSLNPQNQINIAELSYLNKRTDMDYFHIPDDDSFFSNFELYSLTNFITESRKKVQIILGTGIAKNYGKLGKLSSFDMSKIYTKQKLINSFGFQSYITEKKSQTSRKGEKLADKLLNSEIDNISETFKKITSHYYGINKFQVSENWMFSIMHQMELLYAHYWGAAGIPVYLFMKGKAYFISNCTSFQQRTTKKYIKRYLHNVYDFKILEQKQVNNNYCSLDFSSIDLSSEGSWNNVKGMRANSNNDYYIHFLREMDSNEIYKFEDFSRHIFFNKLAILNEPFKLISFFHFDPRRFIPQSVSLKKHIFLTETGEKNTYNMEDIKIEADKSSLSGLKYKWDIEELKKQIIGNKKYFVTQFFWGIKMYAALGFPPYFGIDTELTKFIFPMLGYSDIEEIGKVMNSFYNYCSEQEIPITCHASPQGMTIADSAVYLKEFLKQNKVSIPCDFPSTRKSFILGLGLLDDFSSPQSWEIVLKKYRKLKVCLAHFGGSRFMDGTFGYEKDNLNGDVRQKKISCKIYYRWMEKISELIQKYDNVYTDLSCYSLKDSDELFGPDSKLWTAKNVEERISLLKDKKNYFDNNGSYTIYGRINEVAENLKNLIEKNGKLKDRIMYGSDWPMFETDIQIGTYNSIWFLVMQLLTDKLGCTWDVWHQFVVINPLRFLGLIDDNEKTEKNGHLYYKYCKKGKEKLESYRENLMFLNHQRNSISKEAYLCRIPVPEGIIPDEKSVETLIINNYKKLHIDTMLIPMAEDIINKSGKLHLVSEDFYNE